MKSPVFDSEIIALAWEDAVSFDAIEAQTGLSEDAVIALMRRTLKPASFRRWRARVSGRASKHRKRGRGTDERALAYSECDIP